MDLFSLIAWGIMIFAILALLILLARYFIKGNDSDAQKKDIE